MVIIDVIGKRIIDIHLTINIEASGLDTAQSFIQIDNGTFFRLPFIPEGRDIECDVPTDAESVFKDLPDIPFYLVNKEGKTVGEIAARFKRQQNSFSGKLRRFFSGKELPLPKEYVPFGLRFYENKFRFIKGRKIVDFIWYPDEDEPDLLLLENGYLITERHCGPNGTGQAGLHIFDNIGHMASEQGEDYLKLSNYKSID